MLGDPVSSARIDRLEERIRELEQAVQRLGTLVYGETKLDQDCVKIIRQGFPLEGPLP